MNTAKIESTLIFFFWNVFTAHYKVSSFRNEFYGSNFLTSRKCLKVCLNVARYLCRKYNSSGGNSLGELEWAKEMIFFLWLKREITAAFCRIKKPNMSRFGFLFFFLKSHFCYRAKRSLFRFSFSVARCRIVIIVVNYVLNDCYFIVLQCMNSTGAFIYL